MKKTNEHKSFIVLCYILFAVASVFSIWYMGVVSFHHDSLYSIGFFSKHNSFGDMLNIFITDEVTNPPLYYIFMFFWYRIVPATEIWMLFPNYILFVIGLHSLSIIVLKYTKRFSCLFILMAITWINAYTFGFMLFNLRAYCLLFTFSSVCVCFYDSISSSGFTYRNRVVFGILLFCTCFTHYYGIFSAIAYGMMDLWWVIKKKRDLKKSILSYIIVIVLLCPYLTVAYIHRQKKLSEFWCWPASPLRIIKTMAQFFGNEWLFLVFAAMICVWILYILKKYTIKSILAILKTEQSLIYITCIWISFFTFAISCLYSNVINPSGGIYLEQYFISVKPLFLLLFCFLWGFYMNLLEDHFKTKNQIMSALTLITCMIILSLSLFGGKEWYHRHLFVPPTTRNMAKYIEKDIEKSPSQNSAIYVYEAHPSDWNVARYPIQGYSEFYLKNDASLIPMLDHTKDFTKYDKIYLWHEMFSFYPPDIESTKDFMKGYRLIAEPENTGMWIFERAGNVNASDPGFSLY